jgi:hypothetical protein
VGYRISCDTEIHGIQKFRGILKFIGYSSSWAIEVHGIQKFIGNSSSWDTEVHGIQQFMGYISSWDTEVHLREIRKFLGCITLENTEAQRIEGIQLMRGSLRYIQ